MGGHHNAPYIFSKTRQRIKHARSSSMNTALSCQEPVEQFQRQFVCLTAVGAHSRGTSTAGRAAIAG